MRGERPDHQLRLLRLRRIGYRDLESGKRYESLTNHFGLGEDHGRHLQRTSANQAFLQGNQVKPAYQEFCRQLGKRGHDQDIHGLNVCLLLAYQKFPSRSGLPVQQLFQLNLLGGLSLEELLNPRRRKNGNS